MSGTIFKAGAQVTPLTFSVNPVYPAKIVLQTGLVRALTEGGEDYVYNKGPGYALHYLRFENMPASDFDGGFDYDTKTQAPDTQSLVNWIYSVCSLGLGVFTYEDAFGVGHSVTIADTGLEFSMTGHGLYEGLITLKEIMV